MKAQNYGFNLSLNLALDEGWVVDSPPRPTPPEPIYTRERDRYSLCRRLGGPQGPVWVGEEQCRLHRNSISGPSIQ